MMVLMTERQNERDTEFPECWSGHWKRSHTPTYQPDGSILPSKPKKRPLTAEQLRQKRTPRSWLTAVVDGLDLGIQIDGIPIHANTSYAPDHFKHGQKNAQMIDLINERLMAGQEHRKATIFPSLDWKTDNLVAHCDDRMTLFYVGKPGGLMMVAFDVDNKRRGTAEGALGLCEHLASFKLFRNLYHEPSRGGVGRHANFILDPCGLGVPGVKSLLKMACIWANYEAQQFDVEMVEMKGLPPETVFENGKVQTYKAGVLATVPRGLFDRFDEIKKMPVVRADALRQLVSPACRRHMEVEQAEKQSKKESSPQAPAAGTRTILPVVGSMRGKHISDEMLAGLSDDGCFGKMASDLLGDRRIPTTTKAVAIASDLAILLMILEFCTDHISENNGLPENRIAKLWEALYQCGDVDRAYNHHRLKVLRNFLSDRGMIDWKSSEYRIGWYRKNGDYVPGECMKWKLDQKVMAELEKRRSVKGIVEIQAIGGKESSAAAVLSMNVLGGKAPSMETTICELFPICHPEEQIRPRAIFQDPRYVFRPPDYYPNLPNYQQQLAA